MWAAPTTCFKSIQSAQPCVFEIPYTSSTSMCPGTNNFSSIFQNFNILEDCLKNGKLIRKDGVQFSWNRNIKLPYMSFAVVVNLNEILSQMSAQSCFVMLDNYANVNISPLTHPTALRRLELSGNCHRKRFKCYGAWVPAGLIPPCSFFLYTKAENRFSRKFIQHLE